MDQQAKKEKRSMIVVGAKGFAVILGGNWNNGSNSGSRTSNWNNQPWNANNNISARFAAVATKMCRFVPLFLRGIGRVLHKVPAFASRFGKLTSEWWQWQGVAHRNLPSPSNG